MAKLNPFMKLLPARFRADVPVVPVVRLQGAIMAGGSPLRPGLSLATAAPMIEKAFSRKGIAAVAVVVNSPGGSPVQSVYAFCEDVAASGGYWLATAGDEIYANSASIVGSIGVVAAGFGFPEAMKKLGVERRVYTAGEAKVILDPFQPEKKADVARLKAIQEDIHELFKAHVRRRRGVRLVGEDKEVFSGAFWPGAKALELGLIDGIGDMHGVLRDKFGDKLQLKPVSRNGTNLLRRLMMPGGENSVLTDRPLAAGLADDVIDALESRALWQRYGL
jgi:ClpP class serine protease